MTSVSANDTTLYYELRGDGPSLLLISGATGDAGHWTDVADKLADNYTVITYDRRGNSRSPRPPGWTSTSQAFARVWPPLPTISARPSTLAAKSGRCLRRVTGSRPGSWRIISLFRADAARCPRVGRRCRHV